MDNSQLRPPHLPNLPFELLNRIAQLLEFRDLKNTRLCSKSLCTLCSPFLFKRYILYPHKRSFDRLLNIAGTPLRYYLRNLEIDAIFSNFANTVTEISQARLLDDFDDGAGRGAGETKDLLDKVEAFHVETLAHTSNTDVSVQTRQLEHCFSQFDNLEDLVVYEFRSGQGYNYNEIPSFYSEAISELLETLKCQDMRPVISGGKQTPAFCAFPLLMAARKLPRSLKRFKAANMNWKLFLEGCKMGRHQEIVQHVLSQIETLDLSTQDSVFPEGPHGMNDLQSVLEASKNLEELSIRFRCDPNLRWVNTDFLDESGLVAVNSDFDDTMSWGSNKTVPFRLIWSSKLRRLHLTGFHYTLKQIQEQLTHCAASLEGLHLENVALMPEVPYETPELYGYPRACFVAFFKWIKSRLRLKSVSLRAQMINGGMQCWYLTDPRELFPDNDTSDFLLTRVENWLLDGGKDDVCPIEHLAIKPGEFDFKRKQRKRCLEERETGRYAGAEYAGDDSWTMKYYEYDSQDPDR